MIGFSICCFIFVSLFTIFYFSKERINTIDTRLYSSILICNLFGLVLDIFGYLCFKNFGVDFVISECVSKIYLVYYFTWAFLFLEYIYVISFRKNVGKLLKNNRLFRFNIFIIFIMLILILLLPINIVYKSNIAYTSGVSVTMVYALSFIMVGIMLFCLIKNIKRISSREYVPLLAFMFLSIIIMIIQITHPELTLLLTCHSIVTALMYFTIENPDVKILNEMELAKSTALKANDAKNEFLSSMSHEIRTPMNNIKGCIEILNDDSSLNKNSKEVLDELNTSVDSLLDMSDGILNMVQLESGNMKVECKEYNPMDVLDDVTKLINKRIKSNKIEFVTNYKNIPDKVYGDKNKFKTILINLLNNAVKYTNNGKISMNVLAREDRDECFFTIQISDTGKGIEPNMKKKVFNKFVRENDVKNSSTLGLGLGLTITKSLVELMHRNIVLRSEKGEGTYVLVMFPQYLRYVKSNKNEDMKKILMVDDRMLTVSIDKMVLKSYGIDVDFVKSGMGAIEMVKNNNYDLILLYDEMNVLDGIQTMKKLKFDYGFDKPIIAYTENLKNKDNLLESGFDDFIGKPINSDELYDKLSKYL